MTTSGTTTFDLQIDDIVDEAYERCGIGTEAGFDLKKARVSLNILFSEWGNRGIHLWKVALQSTNLVAGTTSYNTPSDCGDVLEAVVRDTSGNDVALTKISRSQYSAIPNKSDQGSPSQYYVDRQVNPVIYLYQTPDAVTYTSLRYYYVKRIQDAGAYTNTADVPYRFLPCMVSGLAYYLSFKYAPTRTEQLKMYYEDELLRAIDEDGQRTSLYISPQSYYPNI
jgi:hypothetical protein